VLQEAGHRIIEAANAYEALWVLQARPDVHVVVTDVEMPLGPTGYDLAAQVRERWPYVQVLVSSGTGVPGAATGRCHVYGQALDGREPGPLCSSGCRAGWSGAELLA
jgi:DNA-binding NtrC family response regulator